MRPTDENQSTSTRPNLMSPRRPSSSGEASILAMLEREPARKRGGATGARRAWYGAGAGLALALTGALVWLAANNDGTRRGLPASVLADAPGLPHQAPPPGDTRSSVVAVGAAAPGAPPGQPGAAAALHQVAMASTGATAEIRPGSAALIVDQPPAEAAPPLRLLKPGPGKTTAGQTAATPRVPVPAPTAAPAARAPAKAAVAPSKPKPVLLTKSAARPVSPKNGRGGAAARKTDGPVDADVALISAVIVHANGHAPEGSQMTELLCPNDSCQAKPARQ